MPLSCAPSSPISPPRWYRASPPNAPRLVARCDWFEMPKGATYIYIKNITVTFTYVRGVPGHPSLSTREVSIPESITSWAFYSLIFSAKVVCSPFTIHIHEHSLHHRFHQRHQVRMSKGSDQFNFMKKLLGPPNRHSWDGFRSRFPFLLRES